MMAWKISVLTCSFLVINIFIATSSARSSRESAIKGGENPALGVSQNLQCFCKSAQTSPCTESGYQECSHPSHQCMVMLMDSKVHSAGCTSPDMCRYNMFVCCNTTKCNNLTANYSTLASSKRGSISSPTPVTASKIQLTSRKIRKYEDTTSKGFPQTRSVGLTMFACVTVTLICLCGSIIESIGYLCINC